MVPVEDNPVDRVWTDRPAPPKAPAVPHPITYAGRTSEDKRADVAKTLRDAKQDAAVLTDPASIAWLLNIRGGDVPFTPFALSFALLHADATTDLFIDPGKVSSETRAWLGNAVSVADRLRCCRRCSGWRARLCWSIPPVRRFGSRSSLRKPEPWWHPEATLACWPRRARTWVSRHGVRAAHLRDAVALCRFLHWLSIATPNGGETEMSAADSLLAFRNQVEGFRGESFPAISGAGEHGAIIHYRVSSTSNRPIKPNEVYLIDSGAQYPDGTTDVTRTIWTGPDAAPDEIRDRVTRVMQGHIAIATAVFPAGVGGAHLDAFARAVIMAGGSGLRSRHGTRRWQLSVRA